LYSISIGEAFQKYLFDRIAMRLAKAEVELLYKLGLQDMLEKQNEVEGIKVLFCITMRNPSLPLFLRGWYLLGYQ